MWSNSEVHTVAAEQCNGAVRPRGVGAPAAAAGNALLRPSARAGRSLPDVGRTYASVGFGPMTERESRSRLFFRRANRLVFVAGIGMSLGPIITLALCAALDFSRGNTQFWIFERFDGSWAP